MLLSTQLASSTLQPSLNSVLEAARHADDLGIHSVYVSDHIALPFSSDSGFEWHSGSHTPIDPDAHFWEPLTLLSYLAGQTSRVRLGTSVLVAPYRHPLVAAKQIAGVDALSGGRVTIGIGSGWYEEEFKALGVPFHDRGRITDETVAVFREVWSRHPAAFDGTCFSFDDIGVMPKPVQRGGIPVYVGGNSRVAIDRAVRVGQGWQPALLPGTDLQAGMEHMRALCQQRARPVQEVGVALRLVVRVTDSGPRTDEGNWKGAVVGTADEVDAALHRYADMGVTEVIADLRTCQGDEAQETLTTLSGLPLFGLVSA